MIIVLHTQDLWFSLQNTWSYMLPKAGVKGNYITFPHSAHMVQLVPFGRVEGTIRKHQNT